MVGYPVKFAPKLQQLYEGLLPFRRTAVIFFCNALVFGDTPLRNNQAVVLHQKAGEIRDQRYQYAVKRFYHEKLKGFVEA